MCNPEIDLLKITKGTVTAPAGCGKTHLIAAALSRHSGAKPILVLTHTNAGVSALKSRLDKAQVPQGNYRLSTIDGWAMRLAKLFPQRSSCSAETLKLKNPGRDYPAIRNAAVQLVSEGHINDALAATYAHMIVDEYQDCSIKQHAVVVGASAALPTCILGDPLQAIFGFGGDDLANWNTTVCKEFPIAGVLSEPWRWKNAGEEEFGKWLLFVRAELLARRSIDLSAAPKNVTWVPMDGVDDHAKRLKAVNDMRRDIKHNIIAIADSRSPQGQQRYASIIPGASTVEAVDLKDLVSFATNFRIQDATSFKVLIEFIKSVMTGISFEGLMDRLRIIVNSANKTPPTHAENACLNYLQDKTYQSCINVIHAFDKQPGTRVYRPAVYRSGLKALQMCANDSKINFLDAAVQVREQSRLIGRSLPKVAVGSTLLVKGLEAECAIILEAESLNANNLYVAMTRGAISLAICSRSHIVDPHSK